MVGGMIAPPEYLYLLAATLIGASLGLAKAIALRFSTLVCVGCVGFYGAIGAAIIATGPYSSPVAWGVVGVLALVGVLVVGRLIIARIR